MSAENKNTVDLSLREKKNFNKTDVHSFSLVSFMFKQYCSYVLCLSCAILMHFLSCLRSQLLDHTVHKTHCFYLLLNFHI